MPDREGPFPQRAPSPGPQECPLALLSREEPGPEALGVLEHADACVDLEGGPQLDVHGAHQVVLLEQQQSLPVDFLGTEFLCYLLAA